MITGGEAAGDRGPSTRSSRGGAVVAAPAESVVRALVERGLALAIFTAFLLYYGLVCLRPEWGGDFQMYCAGIARLYRDMLHPMHESMNVPGDQSTVYTPFLVVVALGGKLFGATPFRALQVAGIVNLCLFALGICFLFSRVSVHRRWSLPAACFLFTTLCLRWLHFGWSSETSLVNLQYIQPLPSTFAWALVFVAFGLLEELRARPRWLPLFCLIAAISLLLACHVLTASWVVGMVALFGLCTSIRRRTYEPLAWAVFALAAALVPVVLWPYASFFGQSSMQGVKEGSIFGASPFIDFPNLYALAIPCFAYFCLRLRRHGMWLLGLVVTTLVLLVWRQLGVSYGNRYAFFAAFFAQLIVAETMALGISGLLGSPPELALVREASRLDRLFLSAVLLCAGVIWLPSPMLAAARQTQTWGTLRSPRELLERAPQHELYYAQFSEVTPYISADDVVLMPVSRAVLDFASVTGASVISTPLAMRVPDGGARFRAVHRFFDPSTSPEARSAIARQYGGASKVLVPRRQFALLNDLTRSFGEPLYRGDAYAVFGVTR